MDLDLSLTQYYLASDDGADETRRLMCCNVHHRGVTLRHDTSQPVTICVTLSDKLSGGEITIITRQKYVETNKSFIFKKEAWVSNRGVISVKGEQFIKLRFNCSYLHEVPVRDIVCNIFAMILS